MKDGRKSMVLPGMDIICKPVTNDAICQQHHQVKDQIVFKDFEKYKVGDAFCATCNDLLQDEYEIQGKQFLSKPSHVLILRNAEKIIDIKKLDLDIINRNLSSATPESTSSLEVVKQNIEPIPGIFTNFIESVKTTLYARISGNSELINTIKDIKEFIDTMTLTPKGEPVLESIGNKEDLKIKYANLAKFLLHWNGLGEIKGDFTGIVEHFKLIIQQYDEFRTANVKRMDALMISFLGPFYNFIFSLENRPADEEFRKLFLNEYRNEAWFISMTFQFQQELEKRDRKFKELEEKYAILLSEKTNLQAINYDYSMKVDDLNQKLISMRLEFESKIKTALETLKNEYEKKINEVRAISNEWERKCNQLELNSKMAVSALEGQIATLNANFKVQISTIENERNSIEENYRKMVNDRDSKIILLTNLIGNLKEDWRKLNEAYALLDNEVNSQLCCNDELRAIIKNVSETRETHNNFILGHEAELKLLFEQFVRGALKKKTIDFNYSTEKIDKCAENSNLCKQKLLQMRSTKPTESMSFTQFENLLNDIKPEMTTFTDSPLSTLQPK